MAIYSRHFVTPIPKYSKAQPTKNLAALLTTSVLRDMAGETVFNQGTECADSGSVHLTTETAGMLIASVKGTEEYTVSIAARKRHLGIYCSCSHFADANVCMHLVATGLVWLRKKDS